MTDYRVIFTKHARKQLENIETKTASKIFYKIESLVHNPHPRGCVKLKSFDILWRIRVGKYRVVYTIDGRNRVVDIISVDARKDVYRRL